MGLAGLMSIGTTFGADTDERGIASLEFNYSGQFTSIGCTIGDINPINLGVWDTSSETGIGSKIGSYSPNSDTAEAIIINCNGDVPVQFKINNPHVDCPASGYFACFNTDKVDGAATGVVLHAWLKAGVVIK